MMQQRSVPAVDSGHTTDSSEPTAVLDHALARVARLELTLAATGGALHDVNNLLTVLAGQLYLMTEAVREQPDLLKKSRRARNAAERASTLIRELLSAARDPDDTESVICPARHATAMEPLLRRIVDTKHQFTVKHSENPWSVAVSAAQLESAITNLVLNAQDALSKSGNIVVRVENATLDEDRSRRFSLPQGHYVRLRVADTGVGIPKEMLSRVTDALVTSKLSGHGNGMGLAMVKRFATQAGGTIHIKSEVGRGTTMDLWLPRCTQPTDVTANMTMPLSTLPAGSETILLQSQDAGARGIIQQLLEALGYTVLEATSKSEALIRAGKESPIDVVICERSTRDRDAEARWVDELRKVQPDVRQLAIVGEGKRGSEVAPDADAYLHRPLSIAELATSLRSAMEANS